jgi:hypothetical protein
MVRAAAERNPPNASKGYAMTADDPTPRTGNRISGLDELANAAAADALSPVERWNPPYCGDIGMRIRCDGVWLYQGSPIGRKPLVRLFSRILRRDGDGRYYLVTPVEKVDVAVDDAPFLAVEMETEGEGREQVLTFRTNVDDLVRCGPANPMRFALEAPSEGLKPYLLVRGRLEALLTRALYYDLVELAVAERVGGREVMCVWSGGALFPLEPSR